MFKWTGKSAAAFRALSLKIVSPPFIAFPDCSSELILDTDASDTGIADVHVLSHACMCCHMRACVVTCVHVLSHACVHAHPIPVSLASRQYQMIMK